MSDSNSVPIGGIDQASLQNLINQLTGPQQTTPPPLPDSGPSSRDGRGWLSLLGEALGGGQQYGSTAQREQGGISALGAMGLRMLAASDYSVHPHTLGSIIAQGQQGARESLGQTQSVAAAQQAAAYEQNRQAQQDQLARLKEAIPLLELKGKLALAGASPPTLDGSTPGAGAGTYEGAIGGHEGTGQNPNSSAFGTGQFLASTWNEFAAANPELFKGMTPEQILAARSNPELGNKAINWLAQRNAGALTSAGVTPSGQSLGMAHYLGSGPAAAIMKAADSAPVSQFVSAAAVKANPELGRMTVGDMKRRYAGTPDPSFLRTAQPAAPPPGTPAPGRMAIPTPTPQPDPGPGNIPLPPGAAPPAGAAVTQPPISPGAGAQFAGPGAPTTPNIPPSPPGTDATVAAIREGMVRSGADPNTLAPGPVPGMGGTATAGPAAPTPGSYEAYKLAHPLTPSADDVAGFNPAPDPQQVAAIQAQERQAQQEYQQARQAADTAAMAKAREKYIDAKTQENTMRENARKLGVDTRSKWFETQDKQRFDAWTAEVADQRKQADTATAQANKLAEIEAQAKATRETSAQADMLARNAKVTDAVNAKVDSARNQIADLDGFIALSNNAGDPKWWNSLATSNPRLLQFMANAGIVDKNEVGAQQTLQAGVSSITKAMKEGVSLGNFSNMDLGFIERMGPQDFQNTDTRNAIATYLKQAAEAHIRFGMEYNKEMSRPGTNPAEAIDRARRNVPDFVQPIPSDVYARWRDPSPDAATLRRQWAADNNIRPGMMVRKPDGGLMVLKSQ